MFVKPTMKEVSLEELLEEMWKTIADHDERMEKVLIKANPEKIEMQRHDMTIIEDLINRVKGSDSKSEVYTTAAIAVGYANAMQVHGVITENELKRLNALIGTIAERRLAEVDSKSRGKFFARLLRFGKVGA